MNKHLNRLFFSVAWRLMPYADVHIKTSSGFKIPISVKGDPKFVGDMFVNRNYDKFFEHLGGVSTWIDLGCNSGMISWGIYNNLKDRSNVKAVLVDAGKRCLKAVNRTIHENKLENIFSSMRALVGASGEKMVFNEMKHTTTSSAVIPNRKESLNSLTCLSVQDIMDKSEMKNGADLLKIDIEGSEKYLIPSQFDTLDKFRFVWLEYHKPHLTLKAILPEIERRGYSILVEEESEATGSILWEVKK